MAAQATQEDVRVLAERYADIFRSDKVRKNLPHEFKHVRIMVVGRSGSGKSTLIRLVAGQNGPMMCNGMAGIQDINVEWRHPDPDLPLVFHDSDSIDVRGENRVEEIRAFLDAHQRSADLSQRIHLVWYVFSAADNRLADDGGLLQMLNTRHPGLPLLLVMTFNDFGKRMVSQNIDSPNSGFERLLQRISEPSKRQRARDTMVRLGNYVRQMEDGSIKGEQDVEGLKRLTQRTKDLMGEEFHATWIAAQVSDIYAKLDESVKCIIDHKRPRLWTTYTGRAGKLLQRLSKIWGAPKTMEAAIAKEFFTRKAIWNTNGEFAFVSTSTLVLGMLMHVKAQDQLQPGIGQHWSSWNYLHSEAHYQEMCRSFPASPFGMQLLQSMVIHTHINYGGGAISLMDALVRPQLQSSPPPLPPATPSRSSAIPSGTHDREYSDIHGDDHYEQWDADHFHRSITGDDDLSRDLLEELSSKLSRSEQVRQMLAEMFKCTRILVVGRSGSGKSTLIRLVVGDDGPRTICDGIAGKQDISVEWHHPKLPLVFHDSNGIDVDGDRRVGEIRAFLDEHQKNEDHNQRVHLVWYVFSAADNRLGNDSGLLNMLDTQHPNLPLLLIMTHFNDRHGEDAAGSTDTSHLLESRLAILLNHEHISGSCLQRACDMMVRLDNKVRQSRDGSIKGQPDVAGLKLLTQRTKELMAKDVHTTWIAAQVSDIGAKLDESAKCIIKFKRAELLTTYGVGALPIAQQLQLGYMLGAVQKSLCKIWGVPKDLEAAIGKEFLMRRRRDGVLGNMPYDLEVAVVLAGMIVASVFTGGIAAPALLGVYARSAYAQAQGASALFMSMSVLILAVILHVKADQPVQHWKSWKTNVPQDQEHFRKICRHFPLSSRGIELQSFVEQHGALWASPLNRVDQIELLKQQLLSFFESSVLRRHH